MATGSLGKYNIAITGTTKGLVAAAKQTKSILGGLSRTVSSLPFIGGLAGGAASAVGLIKVADAYELAGKRLEAFTDSAQDAAFAEDDLYKMSQETGTSFIKNATALTRFQIAQEQTKLSTKENIEVLGALNKAMQLAGTTGQEAASTMMQLGQALTSGELLGEELRAIKEAAPLVAQAIADYYDVSIGKLKEMGAQGELTSEGVGQALIGMAAEMDQVMDKLPETASKSFQRIINSAGKVWDSISERTGILDAVVEKLDAVAVWIENNEYTLTGWALDLKKYILEWEEPFTRFLSVAISGMEKLITLVGNLGAIWEKIKSIADFATLGLVSGTARAAGTLAGGGSVVDAWNAYGEGAPNASNIQQGQSRITNNFSQALSKSDIADITVGQERMVARQ